MKNVLDFSFLEYFAPTFTPNEWTKKGGVEFKKLAVPKMLSEVLGGAEGQKSSSLTKVVEVKKVLPSKLKLPKNLKSFYSLLTFNTWKF